MSIFEPASIRAILCAAEPPAKRAEFQSKWNTSVEKRCKTWATFEKKRIDKLKSQSQGADTDSDDIPYARSDMQLRWMAEVVEYVNHVHSRTRVHGNAKSVNRPVLSDTIPLLGPRFVPPPPALVSSRRAAGELKPDAWYLRPLNIVHEFFFPDLRTCRVCGAGESRTSFEGWASSVPRRVHGVTMEEFALGQQLKCQQCRDRGNKPHSYALTSDAFWKAVSFDDVPATIPIFTKRCAMTRELFDIAVEQRLGSTASGFAETVRQLHLQRYFQDKREYVALVLAKTSTGTMDAFVRGRQTAPTPFSDPYDNAGYALCHASGDVLADIYLDFVKRTRKPESETYLRSLAGVSLSIDSTFKITNKATVVQAGSSQRERLLKGGLFSGINEKNEIVFWRFCQTQSNKEIEETLAGFERRRKLLGAPPVEQCASDNCCKVRSAIVSQLPGAHATLDIFHIVLRYTSRLLSTKATIYRPAVAKDVADALIKTHANARYNVVTEYWTKEEQEQRLTAVWAKWSRYEIWQSGAADTHREQMGHVRKGCVTRARSDLSSDGSRIEGSHKGWNSLNRTFTGGIESLEAQGHDLVLRKNLRIATKRDDASDFVASTFGSHHISLVNSTAADWNLIVHRVGSPMLSPAPILCYVDSNEQFGLVWAEYVALAPAIKREIAESFVLEAPEDVIELGGNAVCMSLAMLESALYLKAQPSGRKPNTQLAHLAPSSMPLQPIPPHQARSSLSQASHAPAQADVRDTVATIQGSNVPSHAMSAQQQSTSVNDPDSPPLSLLSPAANKRTATEPADEPPPKRACTTNLGSRTTAPAAIAPIFRPRAATSVQPQIDFQQPRASAPTIPAATITPVSQPPPLSRSGALFKAATGVSPDALRITGDDWFLFASLRVSQKLCTYNMTPSRLGEVTNMFNEQLVAKYGEMVVRKDPRAIMSTLSALEATVIARLNANDFMSKNNSETFWRHQCQSFEVMRRGQGTTRKAHTCKRCLKLMYPFGSGDPRNHARDCCSDGANVGYKDSVPYPQPPGVFVAGKRFNIPAFMGALSRLQNFVANGSDKPLEYARFQDLLGQRVQITSGTAYFRCFKDLIHEPAATSLEEVEGVPMLRLGTVGDL
ncbi:hypothetical protein AURDEDRAFT_170755 [Auricularia subglabra TFB-10046 SS5]|uniref:Uncharacterized protein n=1 Tax=Auricularia subglabra (strain TFB-10046 / SS5) TaxID=717982 RepID=J0D210_AURST|nr:hypothetical protein AURDEDRAFT_170755 [Auricularia subglabra TFB-10046 SS5]